MAWLKILVYKPEMSLKTLLPASLLTWWRPWILCASTLMRIPRGATGWQDDKIPPFGSTPPPPPHCCPVWSQLWHLYTQGSWWVAPHGFWDDYHHQSPAKNQYSSTLWRRGSHQPTRHPMEKTMKKKQTKPVAPWSLGSPGTLEEEHHIT